MYVRYFTYDSTLNTGPALMESYPFYALLFQMRICHKSQFVTNTCLMNVPGSLIKYIFVSNIYLIYDPGTFIKHVFVTNCDLWQMHKYIFVWNTYLIKVSSKAPMLQIHVWLRSLGKIMCQLLEMCLSCQMSWRDWLCRLIPLSGSTNNQVVGLAHKVKVVKTKNPSSLDF